MCLVPNLLGGRPCEGTRLSSLHRFFQPAPGSKLLHLITTSGKSPRVRMQGGQFDSAPSLITLASSIACAKSCSLTGLAARGDTQTNLTLCSPL